MKIVKLFGAFAIAIAVSSCYERGTITNVTISGINWTGSGDYSVGNNTYGKAVGLANQDVFVFDNNGFLYRFNNVLSSYFSGPYRLTSIAQTSSTTFYEQTFLHGNLVGRSDNLNIFYTEGGYFSSTVRRIEPNSITYIIDGSNRFYIKEICDLATADPKRDLLDPSVNVSRLFMSVRACTVAGRCVGGIIETGLNGNKTHWGIRQSSGQSHAYIRKPNGSYFNNECMPIAATRWSKAVNTPYDTEYLFVADPSYDEVSSFNALNIKAGPTGSFRLASSGRKIKDITAEGMKIGNTHFSFTAVLWETARFNLIEHYTALDGTLSGEIFASRRVGTEVQLIQSLGNGYKNYTDGYGDLYILGDRVEKQRYNAD